MNFRLAPRALLEAKRKKTWWQTNRPSAPDLFDEEMQATIERIRSSPTTTGRAYPATFRAPVRCVLLPKTENHLFYAVRDGEIVILSVWGARKKHGPKL